MQSLARTLALLSLVFTGAIFGFFYAWVCSTMWGLDDADPRVAVAAMQAMNASVRNALFAPAFFGTPVILALTAIVVARTGARWAGLWFGLAAVTYLLGGLVLTMLVNVPMNEALALEDVGGSRAEVEAVWSAYSPRWQIWNQVRTVLSGIALLMVGVGMLSLPRPSSATV